VVGRPSQAWLSRRESLYRFSRLSIAAAYPWPWACSGRVLAKCHDVRNLSEYEGDLNIDARIVEDLLDACTVLADSISALGQSFG
jgi:hypothetical protein